jgi:hypothetical protein
MTTDDFSPMQASISTVKCWHYWVFPIYPLFSILKNTMFLILDLFLYPSERAGGTYSARSIRKSWPQSDIYRNNTKIFKLFLWTSVHRFGCWFSFTCVLSASFSISVTGLHMHFHNLFCYTPFTCLHLRHVLYIVVVIFQCCIQSDKLPELSQ